MTELIIVSLKDVLLEAIKVIGPPLVGGFIGYRIAKQQSEKRMEEIRETNDYKVRELMFNKGLQEKKEIERESEKLSGALGQLTGLTAQMEYVEITPENQMARPIFSFVNRYKELLPWELDITKKRLDKYSKIEEMSKLSSYIELLNKTGRANNYDELQKMILTLQEINIYTSYCEDLIIEEEIGKIVAKKSIGKNGAGSLF